MNLSKFSQLFNSRNLLIVFLFGFSSGLPLLAIGGTMQAWLQSEGVDIKTIGIFALTQLPYSIKFLWAPLLDRYQLFSIGRRRSWILITQSGLSLLFFYLSYANPKTDIIGFAQIILAISFVSATQDIVLDAYRRDILADREIALGTSFFITSYRLAMFVSGGLALYLSDYISWELVYQMIAGVQAICLIITLFAREPESVHIAGNLKDTFIKPFREISGRPEFLSIIAFALLYKIGDNLATWLSAPYILELGYSRGDYGLIFKSYGLITLILGGIVGGFLLLKIDLKKALYYFGIIQIIAVLSNIYLNHAPVHLLNLAAVITIENFSFGLGTAAFSAYLAIQTKKEFSASQYALLSSIITLPRTVFSASTGYLADFLGWDMFFCFCALTAIPGMLMIKHLNTSSNIK